MKQKQFSVENLCTCLVVILLVVLAVNFYLVLALNKQLEPKPIVVPETPKLELYLLQDSSCTQCFNADQIVIALKQQLTGFNFTKEEKLEISSAKDLITKYKITKAPALLIKGAIDKLDLPGLTKIEDAIVVQELPPPYLDLSTNNVKGLVNVKLVYDKNCNECTDARLILTQLQQSVGVVFSSKQEYEFNTKEAKELVNNYNIKSLPVLIFDSEALTYEPIQTVAKSLGSQEDDGSIVIRKMPPPYFDLATKKVKGLVTATLLVDDSCNECYDVSKVVKLLSSSMGMKASERTVKTSSTEGKKLLSDYNITQVPTFIFSNDAVVYDQMQAWNQVGMILKDGSYLFTNMQLLQGAVEKVTYKDLTTNKVVTLESQEE